MVDFLSEIKEGFSRIQTIASFISFERPCRNPTKSFVSGFVSSKVELKPGKYGFGLFVKSDVKKDEVLLDLPYESAFRYQKLFLKSRI